MVDDDEKNSLIDPKSSEKVIAETLGKLSLEEREKSYEDVHGVSHPIPETPDFVQESLRDMQSKLEMIEPKEAYERAKMMSEEYVMNEALRIGFLRAEVFDAKGAAHRMVRHFEIKSELFGNDKLVEPILQTDLPEPVQRLLIAGSLQLLPSRDSLGRIVLTSIPACHESMMLGDYYVHLHWYMLQCIAADEETQKRGVCYISYALDSTISNGEANRMSLIGIVRNQNSCPLRVTSFHHCYNTNVGPLLPIITHFATAFTLVRIRSHQGSHTECQYKLMTFGIPMNDFPVSQSGQMRPSKHLQWVERISMKEVFLSKHRISDGAIDFPFKYDVLLGRGKPYQDHPGNKYLRELVDSNFDAYNKTKRDLKRKFGESLVHQIQEMSGRFLKKEEASGMWVEASLKEAVDKVCHAFRRKREVESKKSKVDEVVSVSLGASYYEEEGKRLKAEFGFPI